MTAVSPDDDGNVTFIDFAGRFTALKHTPPSLAAFPHRSHAQPMQRASRRPLGFTLLELLVVMVIIGLLAGYVGPRFFSQIGKSEIKTARAQIDALGKALDQYRLDVGRYPATEQGLDALMTAPGGVERWAGPYLRKAVPLDPWGKPYQYKYPGEHGEFDIYSFGTDGQPGGDGEAADVTNW